MRIQSTSATGNFAIIDEKENNLLELRYTNWFNSTAKTTLQSTEIEIKPKNIWSSKFDIFKNQSDKGDIIFNWKGNVIIRLVNEDKSEVSYLLRAVGFWKMGFELLDENERKLMTLIPSFNWKKISYNYRVESEGDLEKTENLIELLIYCGFGANLYMMMMAG